MQKNQTIYIKPHKEVETKIRYFSLPGLLTTEQKLALNRETRTLSLLAAGPLQIGEQVFSLNEMRVIAPILESFPHLCPYEVLLAHISSNTVTVASIVRCRQRLEEAQENGTQQQELRPVRRALSSVRTKLHRIGLEISNVRESGWSLTSWRTSTSQLSD